MRCCVIGAGSRDGRLITVGDEAAGDKEAPSIGQTFLSDAGDAAACSIQGSLLDNGVMLYLLYLKVRKPLTTRAAAGTQAVTAALKSQRLLRTSRWLA